MTYIVKAYKAGYSLRVTIPKPIYKKFEEINKELSVLKAGWPVFIFREFDNHSGYTFALEHYLQNDKLALINGLKIFGEKDKAFTINKRWAAENGIFDNTKLECDVLPLDKPSEKCFNKAICYKVVY